MDQTVIFKDVCEQNHARMLAVACHTGHAEALLEVSKAAVKKEIKK
jgi:hypothetical protein